MRKLTQREEFELERIKKESVYYNNPTYEFKIGDYVKYGYISQPITVNYISDDKKVYGIKYEKSDNIQFIGWQDLRPVTSSNTDFIRNKGMKIDFNNNQIDGLLTTYYHSGINMNPDYQRDYVWETEDKELLIDSIFNNIGIGKIVLVRLLNGEYGHEILDGKQRLNAIIEFYENRFPYKGYYYNDLSKATWSSDLFYIRGGAQFRFYNKDTINTPYSNGLSEQAEGTALVVGSTNLWMSAFCIPEGGYDIFIYFKNGSFDSGHWSKFSLELLK